MAAGRLDPSDSAGIALSNTTYVGEGFAGVCSGSTKLLCFERVELPAML